MKKTTVYEFLSENGYFTEDELNLVIKGWGDNEKTYDTICQVRYGMDADQVAYYYNEEYGENISFSDYKSNLLGE